MAGVFGLDNSLASLVMMHKVNYGRKGGFVCWFKGLKTTHGGVVCVVAARTKKHSGVFVEVGGVRKLIKQWQKSGE